MFLSYSNVQIEDKTVNYSLHYLIVVMPYGRFASKCDGMHVYNVNTQAVQQLISSIARNLYHKNRACVFKLFVVTASVTVSLHVVNFIVMYNFTDFLRESFPLL